MIILAYSTEYGRGRRTRDALRHGNLMLRETAKLLCGALAFMMFKRFVCRRFPAQPYLIATEKSPEGAKISVPCRAAAAETTTIRDGSILSFRPARSEIFLRRGAQPPKWRATRRLGPERINRRSGSERQMTPTPSRRGTGSRAGKNKAMALQANRRATSLSKPIRCAALRHTLVRMWLSGETVAMRAGES